MFCRIYAKMNCLQVVLGKKLSLGCCCWMQAVTKEYYVTNGLQFGRFKRSSLSVAGCNQIAIWVCL